MRTFILLVILAAASRGLAVEEPLWPLDLDTRYLTGNFMEPRGGRYHTGLDLKTEERVGIAVRAVHDGWISRIKIAPSGYGKAIYLTADDGRTYVYGHLWRLADDLRPIVRAKQNRRGRYAVDMHFERGYLPVMRGEVLALSGQTATNGPHLHFEVRSPSGRPLDPMAHGFAVHDTMPPEIVAVRAVGFDAERGGSTVFGNGRTPLSGRLPALRIAAEGTRFSARVIERSDPLRYRLAPYRVRLELDGAVVYEASNDSLSWPYNSWQRLEYLTTPMGRERWLAGPPHIPVAGRRCEPDVSHDRWPAGSHEMVLTATDRAGNTASVAWTIESVSDCEDIAPIGWTRCRDVMRDSSSVLLRQPPLATGEARAPAPLVWEAGPLEGDVSAPGLRLLAAPVAYRRAALTDGWFPSRPFREPAETRMQVIDGQDGPWAGDLRVGVYQILAEELVWVGPPLWSAGDSESTDLPREVGFVLYDSGVFVLAMDLEPPMLEHPVSPVVVRRDTRRRSGVALPQWPTISLRVSDGESGIDWSSLEVTLDGRRLVAEPDPPRSRVLIEVPDTTPHGRHRVTVAVKDRAGHAAYHELSVDLRPSTDTCR